MEKAAVGKVEVKGGDSAAVARVVAREGEGEARFQARRGVERVVAAKEAA